MSGTGTELTRGCAGYVVEITFGVETATVGSAVCMGAAILGAGVPAEMFKLGVSRGDV